MHALRLGCGAFLPLMYLASTESIWQAQRAQSHHMHASVNLSTHYLHNSTLSTGYIFRAPSIVAMKVMERVTVRGFPRPSILYLDSAHEVCLIRDDVFLPCQTFSVKIYLHARLPAFCFHINLYNVQSFTAYRRHLKLCLSSIWLTIYSFQTESCSEMTGVGGL